MEAVSVSVISLAKLVMNVHLVGMAVGAQAFVIRPFRATVVGIAIALDPVNVIGLVWTLSLAASSALLGCMVSTVLHHVISM